MMPFFFCPNCGEVDASQTRIAPREQTFDVRGESITVDAFARLCAACAETISDAELDQATTLAVYDVYRERHHLLSPSQIVTLREKYGLSQKNLALLLGLGEITVHRYEGGALPDAAPNNLLRLLSDPRNAQKLLDESGAALPVKACVALQKKLDALLGRQHHFVSDRLHAMMLFFAARSDGVFKTKLNKLLFYADFAHFRQYGVSLSGASYVRMQFGPVARGYESHLAELREAGQLDAREELSSDGEHTVEKLCASSSPEIWTLAERATLDLVVARFEGETSRGISDISHQEDAWLQTSEDEEIPYDLAAVLKAL